MPYNRLSKILSDPKIECLFIDYYDTLVHRRVHPHYTLRIWAKLMIREFGLSLSIDDLFFMRQESTKYLTIKLGRNANEIPYYRVIEEIYRRLTSVTVITHFNHSTFTAVFEEADVKAELQVQYLNQGILDIVKKFKAGGGKVYLVSDFYGPRKLFERLLQHHEASEFLDEIYVSSELEKSKQSGSIFPEVVSQLKLNPDSVLMIGDNKKSDYINAKKHGLYAYKLLHQKYLVTNKLNYFGSDRRQIASTIQ